jgi:hypothetical protein
MGYDQYSTLYQCWVVPYVDVEMTVMPGSSATQGVCFGALWQSTPTIVSTDVNVLRECRIGKVQYFEPGAQVKTLRFRIDNAERYAISREDYIAMGPNGFGGCVDANPTRGSWLFTWVGTTSSTNDPVSVNVDIRLTYGARFTSPIPNTSSLKVFGKKLLTSQEEQRLNSEKKDDLRPP